MILETVKFINCIIYALLNVFLLYSMGVKDDFAKFTVKKWIIIIVIAIVFILTANYLVPIYLKALILVISTLVLCQLMYKMSLTKKLLRGIISLSIFCFIDTLISFLFVFILKLGMIYVMENTYYYVLYNILNITFTISIAMLFMFKRFKLLANDNISKRTKFLLFTIILLQSIRICVEFIIWYYVSMEPNLQYISTISYICSVFSIGLLLYSTNVIIDKENVIKISNEYSENLKVYNGVLQASIENQRKIAHEHGNQLAALSGYISSENLEKAKQYLFKIIGNVSNADNEYLSHIKESGLKALMVFKVAMMERKNIELETVIDDDIESTVIPSEDMCNIMGVFLDNAIDAASQSEEPYISLAIFKNDDGFMISIMNSIKDSNIDTSKIFKKGYSSKGEGRGFGLHIVDEIIKKYEELDLLTRVEGELFIQELHVTDKSISLTES